MRNPAYRRLAWHILTLGPVGTALPAPGTWASVCTAVVLFLLRDSLPVAPISRIALLGAVAIAIAIGGTLALRRIARPDVSADHPSIVLDEVAGMLVAAAPGAFWTPGTFVHLGIAFVLFRLFDIVKPLGIRSIDRQGTPGSVFLDDLVAGACAGASLVALDVLLH